MHNANSADGKRDTKPQRQTYTLDEFGAMLGVGRNQVYAAAREGQIPTIRIGKRILVPKVAGDRMLSGEAA